MNETILPGGTDSAASGQPAFKTWQCVLCGFIYNEAEGMPQDGTGRHALGRCARGLGMSGLLHHQGGLRDDRGLRLRRRGAGQPGEDEWSYANFATSCAWSSWAAWGGPQRPRAGHLGAEPANQPAGERTQHAPAAALGERRARHRCRHGILSASAAGAAPCGRRRAGGATGKASAT